jgi:Tfp pilus assembly PilM family ATPase
LALSLPFSFPSLRCSRSAPLLGLDIDSAVIRMVELSRHAGRSFRIERYACRGLPEGTVSDEHIQHPGRLADHIAALAHTLGSRCRRVALALPAHAVMTRQMQVRADLCDRALNELMTAEASRYLTVAPEDVRVDYQFMAGDAGGGEMASRDIVLAAARREQVEDRIAAVETAGLIPAALDIDLYAAHTACTHAIDAPAASALILIGPGAIRIALFDRHRLLHHRELPGCNANSGMPQVAVAAARAIRLGAPVDMQLERIFIGGAAAAQPALAPLMQEQFDVECRAWQAPIAAPGGHRAHAESANGAAAGDAEAGPECDPSACLVACGLAMRGAMR